MLTSLPLSERVEAFLSQERPIGQLLDTQQVMSLALAAVRFYHGYARLEEGYPGLPSRDPPCHEAEIWLDESVMLSDSEWAIIRPLFLAYVERETALMLEASRGLGVDVYGRTTSEIANDIALLEQDLPKKAFYCPVISL